MHVPLGRVAKWQTRWLQVPVRATSWGFKSPLAHLLGDPFRPRRRRRRIGLPLILSLILGFGILLAVTSDDSSVIYTEELRKAAVALDGHARTYRNTLMAVGSTDRVAFDAATDQMLTALDQAGVVLESAPTDPAYAVPVALFGESLESWRAGVTAVREQLFAAADDPGLSAPQVRILNALIDVKIGDRVYKAFMEAVATAEITQPVSSLPVVELVPVQIDLSLLAQAAANLATTEGGPLQLRAELMFTQIITEPKMVKNVDDEWVVPATDSLVVKAVVSNDGNTITQPIELVLLLLKGAEQVAELRVTVDPVPPGEQSTAVFEAITVEPGASYGLVIDLPLTEGEERADNNRRVIDFSINLPETTTTTSS